MLSTNQLFLTGLRVSAPNAEPLPADLAAFLDALVRGDITDNPYVAAGMASAALDAFPGSPLWNEPPGSVIGSSDMRASLISSPDAVEWALFDLGRYAYLGRDADLLEVIRRAKHRDGSTASIQSSTATVQMLEGAAFEHPEVAAKFKALGLDLTRVQFGNFPAGAPMKAGAPIAAAAAPSAATVPAAGALISQPAAADPLQVITSRPDLGAVRVFVADVPVSITTALALETSLLASTRALLIPGEGYKWVDELDGLGGVLVTVDGYQAKQLGIPERSGELADRAGMKGASVWEHGAVKQSTDGDNLGLYICTIQVSAGGVEEFGRFTDLNEAKADVSARVRPLLASLA